MARRNNVNCNFGNNADLSIRHNGTDAYIEESGTGALIFKSNIISFRNAADTQQLAQFNEGGGVELYNSGGLRLKTLSDGVEIGDGASANNGELYVRGDITAYYTSDRTLKDNIVPIPNALDKVISKK